MTVFVAWLDGIGRVCRAPALLIGVWLATSIVSAPLALDVRDAMERHLGSSLEADAAAAGVNYDWMQEFTSQASGIATTVDPRVIGFGAVLDNLSDFVDNERRPLAVIGAASVYLGLWTFLAGGIIDRYARNRATRAHGFFSASGLFFFRFLRLGLVAGLLYALLFGYVHPWLFDAVYPDLTLDVTVERTVFVVRLALYLVFGVLLGVCNLLFDYAKVRAVVEDRRSMLGATIAAARFIWRYPAGAAALYLLDVVLFAAVLGLYAAAAPGAGSSDASMWTGFAIGQLYLAARLWVKLVFWASETSLFQRRLAHAGYVARPAPIWPESPSAEALGR